MTIKTIFSKDYLSEEDRETLIRHAYLWKIENCHRMLGDIIKLLKEDSEHEGLLLIKFLEESLMYLKVSIKEIKPIDWKKYIND